MAERATRNGAAPKPTTAPSNIPQYDLEAEQAVLSAVLLSPALLDEVRELVESLDFYSGAHRHIFDALLTLSDAGTRIDAVTVPHQLKVAGVLQNIGGTAYLAQVMDATPAVANVADHARIIHELAVLRRMLDALRYLAGMAQRPETRGDVAGFLQLCESQVFGVGTTQTTRETSSSMLEMMQATAATLDPSKPAAVRGASTGLRELDELTLGLVPGELWYVAARPGMGKTALGLCIAAAVAATGRQVVVFSMEMNRAELAERMLSSDSAVPYRKLQKRELTSEQWGYVTSSLDRLGHLPMEVDDATSLTPSRLRSKVRRHFSKLRARDPFGRPALVVVDYVQLMAGDQNERSRNDELERISRSLKMLAGEFGVTVLALAQLNRASKDRSDKRPTLTDLRGSGALEQDADKVLFIHRDETEGEERGEAELILAKGRNAGVGKILVQWEPWCVRFVDGKQAGFDWGPSHYD